MQEQLETTCNNLLDVINWLRNGYIICIYSQIKNRQNIQKKYYYSRESIKEITDEKIVYIDISENPGLLEEDEWPYYIEREGFQKYISIDKIPTNPINIYHFRIGFKIVFQNK